MKKLVLMFAFLAWGLLAGCGGDDGDNGTGNGPAGPPRLEVDTTVAEPNLDDPHHASWALADSITVEVSGGEPPAKAPPATALGVTSEVQVKAISKSDKLYLQLQWTDPDFDAFPMHFYVDTVFPTTPPIVEFKQTSSLVDMEDQIYVMFDTVNGGEWDVWNWQVLSTGAGGLARGYTWADDTLLEDAEGTGVVAVTLVNQKRIGQPNFYPKDTSAFTGHIMLLGDYWRYTDTVRLQVDTIVVGVDTIFDTTAIEPRHTSGWVKNQRVPGFLVDTSYANRSRDHRGSRWDIKAVDEWDEDAGQYTVVLCRDLSSFEEDLNMSGLDSVRVRLAVFNNQYDFEAGSSNRGFSEEFWLIF